MCVLKASLSLTNYITVILLHFIVSGMAAVVNHVPLLPLQNQVYFYPEKKSKLKVRTKQERNT